MIEVRFHIRPFGHNFTELISAAVFWVPVLKKDFEIFMN
jgi:hypothetical protein